MHLEVRISAAPYRGALIGTKHQPDTLNHWALTVNALQGQPWPELPPLPGRRHVAHDSPLTDAEREELLRDDSATDAEVARVLCLSRQRVGQLRRTLQGCGETPENPAG